LFPTAQFNPKVHWTGVEHPGRNYFDSPDYQQVFRDFQCSLVGRDFVHEPLPFADQYFSIVTFSEVLEHLPVESVNFVLAEISRVLCPGGILIASSPNQAGLENRLRLLKGAAFSIRPTRWRLPAASSSTSACTRPLKLRTSSRASGRRFGDRVEQLGVPGEVGEIHVPANVAFL
jgi:SAM-dependent methyltransferase